MDSNIKLLITENREEFGEQNIDLFAKSGLTPIFCQKDGDEVLRRIEQDKPDIVLMDLFMPKLDSIGIMKAAKRNTSLTKTPLYVVLSSFDSPALEREVMSQGADVLVDVIIDIDENGSIRHDELKTAYLVFSWLMG